MLCLTFCWAVCAASGVLLRNHLLPFEAVAVLPSRSADLLLFDTVQLFRNAFVY